MVLDASGPGMLEVLWRWDALLRGVGMMLNTTPRALVTMLRFETQMRKCWCSVNSETNSGNVLYLEVARGVVPG